METGSNLDTITIMLNKKWRFHLGDCPEAWEKRYADDTWEEVNIPHDWSVRMPFSREYSSGTGYLAGGIGWYRLQFNLPKECQGKSFRIQFDGIYKNSQVWCNSYYLGKRPNGYTTFSYELTNKLCYGEQNNVISIRVDHTDIADSRWFTGSGITRKVTLVVEEPVHLTEDGIFFTTPFVTQDTAQVNITNCIRNDSSEAAAIEVENIMESQNGGKCYSFSSTAVLPPNKTLSIITSGVIAKPYLWSVDDPHLYRLTTKLHRTPKHIAPETTVTSPHTYIAKTELVGIRYFHFDANDGFTLNGKSMKLKGVCVHHDAGCLGAAVLPAVWIRRLEKLKKMGCNAIRTSHNPHMPELYDLCDRMGFLVIDEAFDEWEAPKNKWSTGHNVYPPKHQGYYEDFPTWHKADLKSLIRRDRNHPSVILWSIGNEIDYPNDPYCHPLFESMTGNNDANKPKTEKIYDSSRPNAEVLTDIAANLARIVQKNDPTRPVTIAAAFPELSTQIGFIDSFDVVGYNYKEHLYHQDHERFPGKPFLGSENGHSYDAWRAVIDNDFISGQFLWTGIDYLGEAHGWPIHGSGAGLLTLAGFEKTAYYRRLSFWAEEPVLYLATHRAEEGDDEFSKMSMSWNYNNGELIEVRCYTNSSFAELYSNGCSKGVNSVIEDRGYMSWIIPFEEGIIEACSRNSIDAAPSKEKDSVCCQLETNSIGSQIDIVLWQPCGWWNIGDYFDDKNCTIVQLEVAIKDRDNHLVTSDSTMLFIKGCDNCAILGIENGDLSDNTDYTAQYRRAYHGQLLIYVKRLDKELPASIVVSGEGLKPNTFLIP